MPIAAQLVLVLATFLCSLVAGFLFAFAVVVMPGIKPLGDREFLRAFQAMDRVIQKGQPLFGLVWLGSVVALVAGLALGAGQTSGLETVLLALAGGVYLLGVQLPTFIINIPLNNALQALDVDGADEATLRTTRERFEPRWNRWNTIRAAFSTMTSAMLIVLLLRL
ncbi:MAG: DUF1772 domain-containing protein [Acidobacteria bacterium]|nr:DUF1772 domain-containing protein [Acidobacteriota bacterium]